MTIENELRELILSRYKSVREFVISIDMPYSTIKSIFLRGVGNSSVCNVIKICEALKISTDELARGRIVPLSDQRNPVDRGNPIEIKELLSDVKSTLEHSEFITLDGDPIDADTADAISQGIDVSVELARRHNKTTNRITNKIEKNNTIDH